MNSNRAINMERCDSFNPEGFVKLYARGKIGLLFSGESQYIRAAEEGFRRALNISVKLDVQAFTSEMRNRGASEKAIHDFWENFTLVDEVHLGPIRA